MSASNVNGCLSEARADSFVIILPCNCLILIKMHDCKRRRGRWFILLLVLSPPPISISISSTFSFFFRVFFLFTVYLSISRCYIGDSIILLFFKMCMSLLLLFSSHILSFPLFSPFIYFIFFFVLSLMAGQTWNSITCSSLHTYSHKQKTIDDPFS